MENNLIRYRFFQYIGNTNGGLVNGNWYEYEGIIGDNMFFTRNLIAIMIDIDFFRENFNSNYAFRRKSKY